MSSRLANLDDYAQYVCKTNSSKAGLGFNPRRPPASSFPKDIHRDGKRHKNHMHAAKIDENSLRALSIHPAWKE
jgi:hypothetical protein